MASMKFDAMYASNPEVARASFNINFTQCWSSTIRTLFLSWDSLPISRNYVQGKDIFSTLNYILYLLINSSFYSIQVRIIE